MSNWFVRNSFRCHDWSESINWRTEKASVENVDLDTSRTALKTSQKCQSRLSRIQFHSWKYLWNINNQWIRSLYLGFVITVALTLFHSCFRKKDQVNFIITGYYWWWCLLTRGQLTDPSLNSLFTKLQQSVRQWRPFDNENETNTHKS